MKLYSTNRKAPEVSLKEAVFRSLPADNGLYMPVDIPQLPQEYLHNLHNYNIQEIALKVLQTLFKNYIPDNELKSIVEEAINFDVPVKNIHDNIHALELFHGPSGAFKDFGARFMSRLMAWFLKEENKDIHILVATSGDTGGAVAQGFYDVKGIKVTILYPKGKVSGLQEKQLTTLNKNINALEVNGTFDDCQQLVKSAFLDEELNQRFNLSSANSINISRLIPQSFYYFYAYARVAENQKPVVFSVPSGNFGNLSAGLLAWKMGLPVKQFIAATNVNDTVPQFLDTGKFEPKSSIRTYSNAMDVGNPSNFYRLTEIFNSNFHDISGKITGKSYTDEDTLTTINNVYKKYGYLLCPHSAIGYAAIKDYLQDYPGNEGVFLCTAHPAKFSEVYDESVAKDIILPERFEKMMQLPKKSTLISNKYHEFKEYLLNSD